GVLKEKPLWFDMYKEHIFQRPRLQYGKAKASIQDIWYHEDRIRVKFYLAYESGQRAFDLFNPNFKSTCQRFVEKYTELQKFGETDEEKLFVKTGKALLAEGVILRQVGEVLNCVNVSLISEVLRLPSLSYFWVVKKLSIMV
uniref:Small ribosomal subunit protein mS23 conserved domain-containing protein n=1 Tax=Mandrillus leucophaeus TaxID=9568 RepID=A0A2K6AH80_MANLE